jgi:hypothetical protein
MLMRSIVIFQIDHNFKKWLVEKAVQATLPLVFFQLFLMIMRMKFNQTLVL